MKTLIISLVLTTLATSPAFAISHSYRDKLEKSGCTQVEDAAGTCGHNHAVSDSQTIIRHYDGLKIVWKINESVMVDDKPAAVIESGGYGTTWQQGSYKIITYKNHKIAVMKNDQFAGYAK